MRAVSTEKRGRRNLERCNLQDGDIGADPHAIADGNAFTNAASLRLSSLRVNRMSDAHERTVRSNVAVLANSNVGNRCVHDETAPVDKGRASYPKPQSIVDEKGRLDKGSESLEGWVAEGHVMSDSSIFFSVPSRPDDAIKRVSDGQDLVACL